MLTRARTEPRTVIRIWVMMRTRVWTGTRIGSGYRTGTRAQTETRIVKWAGTAWLSQRFTILYYFWYFSFRFHQWINWFVWK
jgi:hypothetical protein